MKILMLFYWKRDSKIDKDSLRHRNYVNQFEQIDVDFEDYGDNFNEVRKNEMFLEELTTWFSAKYRLEVIPWKHIYFAVMEKIGSSPITIQYLNEND